MKIMLINIDSTIPNIALKKIEQYHIERGDEIMYDFPLLKYDCDKIYVSCIFDFNKHLCDEWEGEAEIGGSGYDLYKTLPPEIDKLKPKLNMGFTTRGCIRNCYLCIVPKKEGKIKPVGDIYDFWDKKSKELVIMDNNILALPDHFFKISEQLKKEKLKVDFNQGLDHRLLTDSLCRELISLKHKQEIRFAFDDIAYKPTVLKALDMLKRNGLKDWKTRWYVYVGEKDTFETVYERILLLKEHKQLAYIMRDKKVYKDKKYIAIAKWVNSVCLYKYQLKDLLEKNEGMKQYKKYFDSILKKS